MNCINVAQLNSGPQSVANIHTVASLLCISQIRNYTYLQPGYDYRTIPLTFKNVSLLSKQTRVVRTNSVEEKV